MATPNDERDRLIRVKGPALPVVRLASVENSTTPVSELIRVKGPALPVVRLTSGLPTPTPTVHLALPLASGADGEKKLQALRSLIEKVNEMEALNGRAGVSVDDRRSEVRDGEVVIVLAPNDPADERETCRRVGDLLSALWS